MSDSSPTNGQQDEGPPEEPWKARHTANVVRFRLREALSFLEREDPIEAQRSLRGWADRLDMSGVPHEVRAETVQTVASAIGLCRSDPPDLASATEAVERAFRLWV